MAGTRAPQLDSPRWAYLFLMILCTIKSVVRLLPLSIWWKMPLLLGSYGPQEVDGTESLLNIKCASLCCRASQQQWLCHFPEGGEAQEPSTQTQGKSA